jgi:hypothetical protein
MTGSRPLLGDSGTAPSFKYAGFSGPHPTLVVDCPTCGSPTGYYCNDDEGHPTDRPHDRRRAAAGTA